MSDIDTSNSGSKDDSRNISKDGLTGLKSKAYFLISLQQIISEFELDQRSPHNSVVAVYIRGAQTASLVDVARAVDADADYATHYRAGSDDVMAGVYTGVPASEIENKLRAEISAKNPRLSFGIAHKEFSSENDADKVLEEVARNAYDSMILPKPAP